jgi:hypothetical protein
VLFEGDLKLIQKPENDLPLCKTRTDKHEKDTVSKYKYVKTACWKYSRQDIVQVVVDCPRLRFPSVRTQYELNSIAQRPLREEQGR